MLIPALEAMPPLALKGLRVLVLIAAAYVLTIVVKRVVRGIPAYAREVAMRDSGARDTELEKRAATFAAIFQRTGSILIWLLALVMALREIGFDIAPIVAGAGVVGIAIGFGAQSLVKDVISGLFILVENQIRVNDVVVINGTGGLVERINLRTTVLRGVDGSVHIFPNGSITTLSNRTREYSYYLFDIMLDYSESTDRVIQIVREVAEEMRGEGQYSGWILDPLDVLGVDRLGPDGVLVKMRIKTVPMRQWAVGREMNRRIRARFSERGVRLAVPMMRLAPPESGPPGELSPGADREELRRVVREVLVQLREEERASGASE